VFTDYEEMLANADIDAVATLTPHERHAEQVLMALEHGKHVLIEKPMAATLEDALKICQAAESKGVHVFALRPTCFIPDSAAYTTGVKWGHRRGVSGSHNSFQHGAWVASRSAHRLQLVLSGRRRRDVQHDRLWTHHDDGCFGGCEVSGGDVLYLRLKESCATALPKANGCKSTFLTTT